MRFVGKRSLLFLGVLLLGCGPDFDPPDQLHSLRVLGVKKDAPYAQVGQTVNLEMLWEDASPKAGRPVQIVWSGPCLDPPGDLYYGCFAQPSLLNGLQTGDTTSFVIPPTYTVPPSTAELPIIRPAASENNAAYGLVFVFFAACAGTLVPIKTSDATAFPLGCQDDAGNLLGSDDFVAGYTSVYVFAGFSNKNPVITGFELNGQPLDPAAVCIDEACKDTAEAAPAALDSIDCADPLQAPRCVSTCSGDGKSPCHGYPLKPILTQADNQEQDSVSAQQLGRNVTEQMWINYYTDNGGFKSPVRLLNDATSGWNDDYGTDFYAPKDPQISRIWALVHDNRGGVAWAGISLKSQ